MATGKKKVAAPVAKKPLKPAKSTAKFISLKLHATIPTQDYGNIQPEIEVTAATYEEARDFAIPHIEALYARFAKTRPDFLGKINVEEKMVVAPTPATVPVSATPATYADAKVAGEALANIPTPAAGVAKPEPVLKAEKAISLATSEDAMLVIQGQIEKSTKIPAEFKADLLTLCLKKRSELDK